MTLKDFTSKEKIINEQLYDKEITSDIFFEEIDFENVAFSKLLPYPKNFKNAKLGIFLLNYILIYI